MTDRSQNWGSNVSDLSSERDRRKGLPPGGPGSTSGGMEDLERRVIVLEEGFKRFSEDMKDLLAEMRGLRTDLAEVKGRVNALPTTLQLLTFVVAIFVAAGVFRLFQ